MWAQNSLWACMGIFSEWANEIRARKFVPQHMVSKQKVLSSIIISFTLPPI